MKHNYLLRFLVNDNFFQILTIDVSIHLFRVKKNVITKQMTWIEWFEGFDGQYNRIFYFYCDSLHY